MANKKQQAAYPPKIRNKWDFLVYYPKKTQLHKYNNYLLRLKTVHPG